MQRMLQAQAAERKAASAGTASDRVGHDTSRGSIHSPAPRAIQTKLATNQPEDEYEQESDRVSDQVMRLPEPQIQRACACGNHTMAGAECEECSKKKRLGLQTKLKVNEPGDSYEQEADRLAEQVMRMPSHPAVRGAPLRIQRFTVPPTRQANVAPPSVAQALASPGRPLEPVLRRDMERRFGYDFSRVRVHTGTAAEQSARDVNAHAYTVGHNIMFAAGQFAPGAHEGRRLLAHELIHVVQQTGPDTLLRDQRVAVTSSDPSVPRGIQRDITRETEKVLPRAQVVRDDKNSNQLLVRYGDEVVATLYVRGNAANLGEIQVADRTSARNQGGVIDTIDLNIVHPPGVVVIYKSIKSSLARTKKQFGVFNFNVKLVERKPPYGKDELQLWPPASELGPMRQRRPLTARERDALERERALRTAEEIRITQETTKAAKELDVLKSFLHNAQQDYDDLHRPTFGNLGGLLVPTPKDWTENWNKASKELYLAQEAIYSRWPGRARVHLRNADAALLNLDRMVREGIKGTLDNIATAESITRKVDQIGRFSGKQAAKLIPGPLGKIFTGIYAALEPEIKEPAEDASDEEWAEYYQQLGDRADELRDAMSSGGHGHAPSKGKGTQTPPAGGNVLPALPATETPGFTPKAPGGSTQKLLGSTSRVITSDVDPRSVKLAQRTKIKLQTVYEVKKTSSDPDIQAEVRMGEHLADGGHHVHFNANDSRGDLMVDGMHTDVKHLRKNNSIRSAISRARKQAEQVVIDGTTVGISHADAVAGIKDFEAQAEKHPGSYRGIKTVYVVEGDGHVYIYTRSGAPLKVERVGAGGTGQPR